MSLASGSMAAARTHGHDGVPARLDSCCENCQDDEQQGDKEKLKHEMGKKGMHHC